MYHKYRWYYDAKAKAKPLELYSHCLLLNPLLTSQSDFASKHLQVCLPLYRVEKVLTNANYIIRKVGTLFTQCVHRIRIRPITPQFPVDDLPDVSPEQFLPDPNLGKFRSEPSLFDQHIDHTAHETAFVPHVGLSPKNPSATLSLAFQHNRAPLHPPGPLPVAPPPPAVPAPVPHIQQGGDTNSETDLSSDNESIDNSPVPENSPSDNNTFWPEMFSDTDTIPYGNSQTIDTPESPTDSNTSNITIPYYEGADEPFPLYLQEQPETGPSATLEPSKPPKQKRRVRFQSSTPPDRRQPTAHSQSTQARHLLIQAQRQKTPAHSVQPQTRQQKRSMLQKILSRNRQKLSHPVAESSDEYEDLPSVDDVIRRHNESAGHGRSTRTKYHDPQINVVNGPPSISFQRRNLLSVTSSIGHCVSVDLAMRKGIAHQICRNNPGLYKMQKAMAGRTHPGSLIAYRDYDNDRWIYNLVTKYQCYDKPSYANLHASLNRMRLHAEANAVSHIYIPKLGSGFDRLQFPIVYNIIKLVFERTAIKLTIFCL